MAFGKKPCCAGCARKPSKARISGNPIAHLFQLGGEVGFANGGEARTDIGAAHPEYTTIFPEFESTLGQIGGRLWRPFLRREVLRPEETRNLGDETIQLNPQTGMPEILSTIETIPGEYGPIEGVNPWTDWPTATELIASGVGNLWKMRDFLSRPENIEQVAGEAVEGAQDYMTQQVDLANRGLTEAYDPETGEMADFTVPLLAAELMTGSLARPAVQLADNEMLTGMAVRPKRAVVRPPESYPDGHNDPFSSPANIGEYRAVLVDRLIKEGVDPNLAESVGAKADKYFLTELGTGHDRIRQGMLAGDIDPAVFEGADFSVFDAINDPLQYWRDHGIHDDSLPRVDLLRAFWNNPTPVTQARKEFERAYDFTSGVERTIRPDLFQVAEDTPWTVPSIVSEANQMLSEGVPPELIQWPMSDPADRSRVGMLLDREATERDSEIPYLKKAYDQGDVIYEIDPSAWSAGLDFLNPQELAPKLRELSDSQLRGNSFPDLVIAAQSVAPPAEVELDQWARRLMNASNRMTADERNARVPTKFKTEVGVTPVLPRIGRTWYSLDTDGAVELEGALMNHSVGGYSSRKSGGYAYPDWQKKDFADKRTLVFSLRDMDGRPRVTTDINFRPSSSVDSLLQHTKRVGLNIEETHEPRVLDTFGYGNDDVPEEYLGEVFALWDHFGIKPQYAMPEGVPGAGAQYMMYLETGDVFSLDDALQYVGGRLPLSDNLNPDGDVELAKGGIVSLVNGCDFNQRRGID